MAKRFTDSDKWKKPLIRGMKAPYKLLWLYIWDDCDHAGIWQVDIDVAQIRIGEQIDISEAIKSFGDRIQIIDSGEKWFVNDFIDFQYGELNPQNRVHYSVIERLKKYKIKPLTSPLQGVKDKDKEKDKDKDTDKDKDKEAHVSKFQTFWELYAKKEGRFVCEKKWNALPEKDREQILKVLPDYVVWKKDIQFRPNPATFLNQRKWEDEIPTVKKSTYKQHTPEHENKW